MPGNNVSTSKRIAQTRLLSWCRRLACIIAMQASRLHHEKDSGRGRRTRLGLLLGGFLGGLRRLLGLQLLPPLHVVLEDGRAVLGRLRADALPVLDARRAQRDARG